MFKITSCVESKKIKVTISKDGDKISEYIFYSKRNGTRVGKRLVYITLLRYAILDCIGMDTISLDKPISRVELCYLQGQINNFIEYSKSYNNLKLDGPKIIYPKILKDKF